MFDGLKGWVKMLSIISTVEHTGHCLIQRHSRMPLKYLRVGNILAGIVIIY